MALTPTADAASKKRKKMADMTLKKLSEQVPKGRKIRFKKVVPRNMSLIKPPASNKFFILDDDPLKAEYNKLVDEEIRRLYVLSQKYKTSKSRGEIWLRLGARFVEKGTLVDFKQQDAYDKKMKLFEEGKIKRKPRPPKRNAGRKYYLRAIQLYEWFVRDFPRDPKVPQALYFLGYSNFEVGRKSKGEGYFQELTKRFPRSVYVTESHLALAEYYFEKEDFVSALRHYAQVVKNPSNRLYGFALYKSAWCYYRMTKYKKAVAVLEKVITSEAVTSRDARKLRLREEAVKDYVGFYSQTGKYKNAQSDFYKVTNSEAKTKELLEALAYRYSYSGNVPASMYLFKKLIAANPESEKAAKYQYQIVQDVLNINDLKAFRQELAIWIDKYGPESYWAGTHKNKPDLLKETFGLQETTLRNHTLRLHQTAVNVKTKYTRKVAAQSYNLYLKYFKNTEQAVEMRFFYAELLYDMKKYEAAADNYKWIALNAPQSKYYEKSVINNVLSLEKKLPSNEVMEAKRQKAKDSLVKIPYTPAERKFEEASLLYLQKFPKGDKAAEIKKRLGTLYYAHNDFDPALKVFRDIIADNPNDKKDAPLAAEYIMDIHNLKKDIPAFQAEAAVLLKNKTIANSSVGKEIRTNLNKAQFLVADKYSKSGEHVKAAQSFEAFAKAHPSSDQAFPALFNAAANYEKAGDAPNTVRMYERVIATPTKDKSNLGLKQDARNSLAEMYKKLGQFEKAAKYYETFGNIEKGKKGENALDNALILWIALNDYNKAHARYRQMAKKGSRADQALYSFERAELYTKQGDTGKAIYHYDQFLKYGWKYKFKSLKAMYKIGEYHLKRGHKKEAEKWFNRCVDYYKNKPGKEGVKYAAQAKFHLVEQYLNEMKRIRLGTREKTIASRLQEMKNKQKVLIKNLADVIKYDYGPSIVAALAAEAESYEIIANAFKNSPVPVEYAKDANASKQFRELAKKESDAFYEKAKNAYKTAFEKGHSLEAFGEPLLESVRNYNRLAPEDTKYAGEVTNVSTLLDKAGL